MSEPSSVPTPPEGLRPLSRRVLFVIASGDLQGREVIDEVNEADPSVQDAQVYGRMSKLQEKGLVASEEVTGQRNSKVYWLTDEGREWLRHLRAWENHYVDGVVDDAE